MNHYAPEYTKRERLLAVAKTTAWAIPLFGLTQFWFLPKFSEYAENAHCYVYGDITGLHLVMYFVFVAVPLLPATFLAILEGPRAIRVIKGGQYPLPGEKVYLKTKYVYGTRARLRSYILIFCQVNQPGYLYLFDYVPAEKRAEWSGAPHASEGGMLFKDNATPVAKSMRGYWVNFIKTGNPNGAALPDWPAVTAGKVPWMVFSAAPVVKEGVRDAKLNVIESAYEERVN